MRGSWLLMALLLVAATFGARAADEPGRRSITKIQAARRSTPAEPKKAPDGRDYVPVFEDPPATAGTAAKAARRRTSPSLLPQPDGSARHLAGAEKGFHGHGLPARLCR